MRKFSAILINLLLLGGLGAIAQAMELSGDFAVVLAVEPVSIESETSKFKFDMEGILNLELYLADLSVENGHTQGSGLAILHRPE